jgi:hypothetical protein
MFFARIARHLEELSDFVRHQIAYLEAIGDCRFRRPAAA